MLSKSSELSVAHGWDFDNDWGNNFVMCDFAKSGQGKEEESDSAEEERTDPVSPD